MPSVPRTAIEVLYVVPMAWFFALVAYMDQEDPVYLKSGFFFLEISRIQKTGNLCISGPSGPRLMILSGYAIRRHLKLLHLLASRREIGTGHAISWSHSLQFRL